MAEENDFSAEQVSFLVRAGEPYARPKTMRNGSCVPTHQRQGGCADRQPSTSSCPDTIAYWCSAVYHDSFRRRALSMPSRRPPVEQAPAVAYDGNCEKQVNRKSRDNVCCSCI